MRPVSLQGRMLRGGRFGCSVGGGGIAEAAGGAAYHLGRPVAAAQAIIQKQGVAYIDEEGDTVTSIVNGKDCVFTCYDSEGVCKCAIEKAYREGKTDFYKPISCHLYPIRITQYRDFKAVNYHRWSVCKAAELLGEREKVPVYRFLKEPLIRKFGEAWYDALAECAEEWTKQGLGGTQKNS